MPRAIISIVVFAVAITGLALTARLGARTQQPAAEAAELVLTNGKVVTVEEGAPDAQAIAIRGSRILAVGSSADIRKHVGAKTQVIDVQGQLVIPGFIEGHGHFTGIGTAELGLKLMHAKTWDEIVAMVAERVKTAKPGEWIYGRGWHQEKWDTKPSAAVEGFPVHDALSKVSPDNPVVLTHASGHATFVNAKAMHLSDITSATRDPEGGDLIRDAKGNLTGLLRERASGLVRRGRGAPALSEAEAADREQRILELATQEVLSKGVTSFQD
nr:amidohydrolase family protein [Acidobacteriota bacterium]